MLSRILTPLLFVLLPACTCAAAAPETLPATWAWEPVRRPELPVVHDKAWSQSPIDRLVLANLESTNLRPAPPADRTALIRRAYFDLIGLPPSAEAVSHFVNDPDQDSFAKVVDGLLANPHFGERWARHWMDLVRYAEGFGHEFDFPITHSYQYRDYLIRAFNSDVPYDQFVREHIAGDLLENPRHNPDTHFNESIIGTGFWWFGEQIHAPVDVRQHQGDRIDNQIDVMAKTFLGLTVACARCHDHKFDPIKQKDYYGLFGIVESSRRQEAMLDPGEKIATRATEIQRLRRQGDKILATAYKASPDRLAKSLREISTGGPATQPAHALFALATLPDDAADFEKWRTRTIAALDVARKAADDSRRKSTLFKSFEKTGYKDWVATGWAFGTSPSPLGQWDATDKKSAFVTTRSAHSGLLASRLKGALYSPSFILTRPTLLYHVAGRGGQVRLVINGYRMDQFSGLLFAGAILDVKTGPEWVWRRQAQDVSRYVGHRAHIEIIDEGDGYVAVDEIRFADADSPLPQDPPSVLCECILKDPSVKSVDSLIAAYAKQTAIALDRLKDGTCDAEQARLISWLASHDSLDADADQLAQLSRLKRKIDTLARELPEPMRAVAMLDVNGFDERVFVRGNHGTPGDAAPRQFLLSLAGPHQPPIGAGSGRMDLARRMIDPSDPLLPRVMVNRLWHHLLGRGIVATVDDFGKMGERPSNPPLLDFLADDFTTHGWSVKRMIRQIVLSRTYQMSSRAADADAERLDPNNILLHRANLRRLEAEEIRDEILAASGRLDLTMFGPSVDVHLTEFMEGRGRPKTGPLDGDGRRSIYLAVRRNFLSPMMLAFDAPAPFNTMGRRSVSNVPAQALMLMNDPFVLQQARRWAGQVVSRKDVSVDERIAAMYRSAFSRPPTEKEIARAKAFLDAQAAARGDESAGAPGVEGYADVAHALMNSKEFIFLD
jgi:hypothetical protein